MHTACLLACVCFPIVRALFESFFFLSYSALSIIRSSLVIAHTRTRAHNGPVRSSTFSMFLIIWLLVFFYLKSASKTKQNKKYVFINIVVS